jgi:cell division protein FtsI (penicillin-binding protein 3)
MGDVEGYCVGMQGEGTAIKENGGGYYDDKVIAFASVFPADDPKYRVIVTLDR